MSSHRRKCKNHPDNFCYICGKYKPPAHRKKNYTKSDDCIQVLLWVRNRGPGQDMGTTHKLQCLQHSIITMAGWEKKENVVWCSDDLARTS